MAKVRILQAAELPEKTVQELHDAFDVVKLPKENGAALAVLSEYGATIRGIAVRKTAIDQPMLARLPSLEIISSYSAGLDGIDVDAAKARGIAIHNTSHILAEDVADLAVSLAVAITRGTVRGHDFVRNGEWPNNYFPLGRSLRALRIGIVGLGHIGSAVARRLEVMGATLAYFGPREKPVPYRYFGDLQDFARWADMIIVTCPASPATYHLIDSTVLAQLGSDGYLVNISRGNIVDEAALIATLGTNALAGAALYVFENEPEVPDALRQDPRVVLSPHMGSGTRETRQQMGDSVVAALTAHFAGA
jgi:lactate dehydrogenase-like 2-hydroxyacid dehydrogenase